MPEDIFDRIKKIPEWVKDFISSGILSELESKTYLTVGFPEIPFNEIKGVRISERRVVFDNPGVFSMKKIWGEDVNKADSKTIWTPEIKGNPIDAGKKLDDSYLEAGYIVITPMTIDENNTALLEALKSKNDIIPNFNAEK